MNEQILQHDAQLLGQREELEKANQHVEQFKQDKIMLEGKVSKLQAENELLLKQQKEKDSILMKQEEDIQVLQSKLREDSARSKSRDDITPYFKRGQQDSSSSAARIDSGSIETSSKMYSTQNLSSRMFKDDASSKMLKNQEDYIDSEIKQMEMELKA